MPFRLEFTTTAKAQLQALEADEKKIKKVRKTLGLLQANPRHNSLNSHKYEAIKGAAGEEVFEVYVENQTPAAYRIFWHYKKSETPDTRGGKGKQKGGDKGAPDKPEPTIVVLAITPHP